MEKMIYLQSNYVKIMIETIQLTIRVLKLQENELDGQQRKALGLAKLATERSYSPYSHFRVGAAVLLDNGEALSGSNQENSAYPSGLCAERTTVFYANSRYPDSHILLLCIAASDEQGNFTRQPICPCGACRQVLVEAEQRGGTPMQILLYGTDYCYLVGSARDLLPLTFDDSFL